MFKIKFSRNPSAPGKLMVYHQCPRKPEWAPRPCPPPRRGRAGISLNFLTTFFSVATLKPKKTFSKNLGFFQPCSRWQVRRPIVVRRGHSDVRLTRWNIWLTANDTGSFQPRRSCSGKEGASRFQLATPKWNWMMELQCVNIANVNLGCGSWAASPPASTSCRVDHTRAR